MFPGNGLFRMPSIFEEQYHCFSMAFSGRERLEDGDKILLPPSALDALARMNVEYPMLFELTNSGTSKKTHCGVLEFSSEEGKVYIPFWMMQNLFLDEGSLISVKNVSLPKARLMKLRAQHVDFLEISNPRAVLEVTLRKFTCVTVGDHIRISHAGKDYYLEIVEVQPGGAASIIETDCNVDFDEPLGFKGSKYDYSKGVVAGKPDESTEAGSSSAGSHVAGPTRELQKARKEDENAEDESKFRAFGGSAQRIDGKAISPDKQEKKDSKEEIAAKRLAAMSGGSSNGSGSFGSSIGSGDSSGLGSPPLKRESKIGDKYSKKKIAASAFTGSGHKLG